MCPRPYAEKAKWADPAVPLGHLRDLFAKYVPPTTFELRKNFVHVVPLNTLNFVSTLCAILEVRSSGGAAGNQLKRLPPETSLLRGRALLTAASSRPRSYLLI